MRRIKVKERESKNSETRNGVKGKWFRSLHTAYTQAVVKGFM